MRNFSFPSTPSFSSSLLPHSSEKQVPFRRLAKLLLFYGKYCDPTNSLRGDQHLRGPIELLIWSSPLSQPFSTFHQNSLAHSPWVASAQIWFPVSVKQSSSVTVETLMRTRILERTVAYREPHYNATTWKQCNLFFIIFRQFLQCLKASCPDRKSSSPEGTAWIICVPLQAFNRLKSINVINFI